MLSESALQPVNSVQHQSDRRLSGADTFLGTQNPSSVDLLFLGILQYNIKTNLKVVKVGQLPGYSIAITSESAPITRRCQSPNNPEIPESLCRITDITASALITRAPAVALRLTRTEMMTRMSLESSCQCHRDPRHWHESSVTHGVLDSHCAGDSESVPGLVTVTVTVPVAVCVGGPRSPQGRATAHGGNQDGRRSSRWRSGG